MPIVKLQEFYVLGMGGGGARASRDAAVVGYTATPVNFDGTNDYGLRAGLVGASDGKLGFFSGWARRTATGAAQSIINSSATRCAVQFISTDHFRFTGINASGTTILVGTSSITITDTAWHHMAVSFNLANPAQRHMIIDGVADASATWSPYTDGSIDYTLTNFSAGATTTGTLKFTGDLADIWFDDQYIDLSVAANLAKFISDGSPVDPAEADTAFGTPLIAFRGDVATWLDNANGSGGAFTVNGELSAGTGPVEL